MDVFLSVGSFLKVLFLNIRLLCCFYHGIGLNSARHVSVLQLNKLSSVNRGSFSDCKGLRCYLKSSEWTKHSLFTGMCRTQQITHITSQVPASFTAPLQNTRIKQSVFQNTHAAHDTFLLNRLPHATWMQKLCYFFHGTLHFTPFQCCRNCRGLLLWTTHTQLRETGEDAVCLCSCASLNWLWIFHEAATGEHHCSTCIKF